MTRNKDFRSLETKHNDIIRTINKNDNPHREITRKIASLKQELSQLQTNNKSGNLRSEVMNQILELEAQLDKSDNPENNYYINVSDVIFNYYNNVGGDSDDNDSTTGDANDTNESYSESSESESSGVKSLDKFVTKSKEINKENLFKEYLRIVDPEGYISRYSSGSSEKYFCDKCNIERTINPSDGIVFCTICGQTDQIIIDGNKSSYKDMTAQDISYFTYKKINHLNETLSQFQGREQTSIPVEVLNALLMEIKKSNIKNMGDLNYTTVRGFLKKNKLSKYYEHIPYIIMILGGPRPPIISAALEQAIRMCFKNIQVPFSRWKPSSRRNFLSYSYIIRKILELLECDDLLPYFPLLKSRFIVYKLDTVWKKICEDLNYSYIPSI